MTAVYSSIRLLQSPISPLSFSSSFFNFKISVLFFCASAEFSPKISIAFWSFWLTSSSFSCVTESFSCKRLCFFRKPSILSPLFFNSESASLRALFNFVAAPAFDSPSLYSCVSAVNLIFASLVLVLAIRPVTLLTYRVILPTVISRFVQCNCF